MINDVRNTVLAILNKDNNGYITPEEFNLFAKNAQREIFEQYFHDYSLAINKINAQMHSSGYADIPGRLREVIEKFSDRSTLTYNGLTTKFEIPAETYSVGTVIYNDSVEVEQISANKLWLLKSSLDTSPTVGNPAYVKVDDQLEVLPSTITSNVVANRIRFPKDPKWTYTTFSGGEPLFDQSAGDYQDFELPLDDMTNLVVKILSYAGVSIRDNQVAAAAKSDEMQEKQEQK
jgi:hypothetical protein